MTGCGVLLNTSFNVQGEPIVCTPEDAYRCFMQTELDVLVLDNCVLDKHEQRRCQLSGEGRVLTAKLSNRKKVSDRIDQRLLQLFGMILGIGFVVIGLWIRQSHGLIQSWMSLIMALYFLSAGLFFPALLSFPYRGWTRFSGFICRIISSMLLSLTFFLVATPTGIVLRLLRRDILGLKMHRGALSYRTTRESRPRSHLEHQF
jgi:hypothetical protein